MKKQYSKNFKNTYIKEKLKEKNAYQLFLNISIFILKKNNILNIPCIPGNHNFGAVFVLNDDIKHYPLKCFFNTFKCNHNYLNNNYEIFLLSKLTFAAAMLSKRTAIRENNVLWWVNILNLQVLQESRQDKNSCAPVVKVFPIYVSQS